MDFSNHDNASLGQQTVSPPTWDSIKAAVHQIFIVNNATLKDTRTQIREETGFTAR